MDVGGTGYAHAVGPDFPSDVTVLEAHSQIVNPDFTRVKTDQGIYNHHNVFMDMTDPGMVYGCDNGLPGNMARTPFAVLAAGATEDGE
jgi:hypothetical protein